MSKRPLGRGLGALIAGIAESEVAAALRDVPVSGVVPNPQQPRQAFDDVALTSLADSIRVHGVLQPLVVREVQPGRYELVAGERRWRAAQAAGLRQVPVVVMALTDRQALEIALIENLQREDLTPLELGRGIKRLLEAFGLTHDDLAARVGMSRAAVTNALRLLTLPIPLQEMLARRALTAGHARALLGCNDPARQMVLARRIEKEGLSVRATELLVAACQAERVKDAVTKRSQPPAVRRLQAALGTPVRLRHRGVGGAIEIPFASATERDRLLRLLGERLSR